jgi:N-acetylglucosamine kinase-like BadF-type ATPase
MTEARGFCLGVVGSAKEGFAGLATDDGTIVAVINAPPLTIRVNSAIRHDLQGTFHRLATIMKIPFEELLPQLSSVCVAMSGVFLPGERNVLSHLLEQIGIREGTSIVSCEDAHAHLAANFLSTGGVVLAGTGSNVFLLAPQIPEPIRVDGWGSGIGDEGGGYDLGRKCLRALFKGRDGRMPSSPSLERRVLSFIGLQRIEQLVDWYYDISNTVRWRSGIADLAIPLVQSAEQDKDPLAHKLVVEGAASLFHSFEVASDRAEEYRGCFAPEPCPLILEGGLFTGSGLYRKAFSWGLLSRSPTALQWQSQLPKFKPIVGAVGLALSHKSMLDTQETVAQNLRGSAANFNLKLAY